MAATPKSIEQVAEEAAAGPGPNEEAEERVTPLLPATRLDALVTVTLLAVLTAGLITCEAIRFSEARQRIRASVHA